MFLKSIESTTNTSSNSSSASSLIIHFIGIGGIGISGIAQIIHCLGYRVQGSDIKNNSNTERLAALGIKIFFSQKPTYINNASYVVISSAISLDNLEVQEALKLKIPVVSKAEILAALIRCKNSIAVSGSHGKTTTTSMIASLFETNNLNPTVFIGGNMNHRHTNAYLGKSDYFILEVKNRMVLLSKYLQP